MGLRGVERSPLPCHPDARQSSGLRAWSLRPVKEQSLIFPETRIH
jgi:hypothetical protein